MDISLGVHARMDGSVDALSRLLLPPFASAVTDVPACDAADGDGARAVFCAFTSAFQWSTLFSAWVISSRLPQNVVHGWIAGIATNWKNPVCDDGMFCVKRSQSGEIVNPFSRSMSP